MRQLFLIIQLVGLSALLLGSIVGTFSLVVVLIAFLWAWGGSPDAASYLRQILLIFIGYAGGITLYWRFIVFEVFKHVRKSLRQKPNKL